VNDERYIEVRVSYRYGVNSGQRKARVHSDVEFTVNLVRKGIESDTGGPVEITKIVTREVLVVTTDWTEWSAVV
jgi:hypothetical protein